MAKKKTRKTKRPTPEALTLCAYNIGFGDCLLLSFHYPRVKGRKPKPAFDRHVLIDFGLTRNPKDAPKKLYTAIAEDIGARCHGKLDVLAVTHRHKDHLSGFTTKRSGGGPGDLIRELAPSVILMPWTEDPSTPTDAKRATTPYSRGMQAYVAQLHAQLANFAELDADTQTELEILGEQNIDNANAIDNLHRKMREEAGSAYRFCNTGMNLRLGSLLPGMKVHCLGPPTLDDAPNLEREVEEDYWHLSGRALAVGPSAGLRDAETAPIPAHLRHTCAQLRSIHVGRQVQIMRDLDTALNNTSLILMFEVAGQCLLFPGDAEIENWNYALSQPRYRKLLARTSLLKVSHHGSHNGTPEALWELFENKREDPADPDRMWSIISTRSGKPHKSIPNPKLMRNLRRFTELHETEEVRHADGDICLEIRWDLS